MKNIEEILIFYLKTALFIAIAGITMGAFVLGGFYYSINKTNTHTQYYDDLYQVSVIYPDSIINALMNNEKTDFNVIIGLCVGHDSLFYKYSEALCTTLVTKDKVLAHNPVGALYQTNTYYKKLMKRD